MIIAKPLPISVVQSASSTGGANLLTPSPKEVWVANAVGTSTIDVDLGSVQDVDTFFLGFTNAAATATWQIQKGTGLGTGLTQVLAAGTLARPADSLGPYHHLYAKLAAPVSARYFRLSVIQTGTDPLLAGVLLLSKAFKSAYEFGSGRQLIDTGSKEELPDGGFGLGEGVTKAALRWTFPDLSAADRRALWALVKDRGERRPVLVAEELQEGAGTNEELHYGLFDRFEAYERQAPGSTRWSLSMTEWV